MPGFRRLLLKSAVVTTLGVAALLRNPTSASAATTYLCFEDCVTAISTLSSVCPWEAPAFCEFDHWDCDDPYPAKGYCWAAS